MARVQRSLGICRIGLFEVLLEIPCNSESDHAERPSLSTLVWRGAMLRCPACGQGQMFRNWLAMNDPCQECGRKFNRAPGYLLGSIYFNYGVTAMLVVVLFVALYFPGLATARELLYWLTGVALVFPLWFFRYARGLWIAFDELFDPWPNEQERRELMKSDPTVNA